MKEPAIPPNEDARLATLESLGIIYTPAEERFDRITRLARKIFDVPIVLISLVTKDTQWFKSCQGLTAAETPRKVSFCAHAILQNDPLIIVDTYDNPDFADNPLVTGEPFIRFYAGQVINYKHKKIGTLCLIDSKPHVLFPSDIDTLKSLALWVENELKLTAMDKIQKTLIKKYNECERKTMIDQLTGVWNWKGVIEVLNAEISRAKRTNKTVNLLKISIDNMMHVNDDEKLDPDDMIIKKVIQRIRTSLRNHDVIGRHGNTEFLVFMTDIDKESARKIAQRLILNMETEPFTTGYGKVTVSLSIGMNSNEDSRDWDLKNLIKIAESALYDASLEDRNKCVIRDTV